jgi:hypothetical protein
MCGKETCHTPQPKENGNTNHIPIPPEEDGHADWVNKVTTTLAQQVNTNINITRTKNKMLLLSNITEDDLSKLQFLTNTDRNNNHGRIIGFGVTIPGNNNVPLPIEIPGLPEIMSKIFDDSDAQAFLASKITHTPYQAPFIGPIRNNSMSVSYYIDFITLMNPSMPKTANKTKTYSLTFSPKSHQ